MALVGGGAGNVTGSNPSGTSSSIKYIGDHAYVASGQVEVDNNVATLADFTTGSSYVVGEAMFAMGNAGGDDYEYTVLFDDQVVDQFIVNGGANAPDRNARPLLMPGYTRVQFTAQNVTDTSAADQSVFFVGRVYG
jgi:hypothetical protein